MSDLPVSFGKYKTTRVIGQGAMGVVYQAFDPSLERSVAIKTVVTSTQRETEALIKEARAAAALNHPHLMTIFDCGASADGSPYLVLELLAGETLKSFLTRKTRMEAPEVLSLIDQVAKGLDYAHTHGVIHCDVKPANLFLTDDHRVKILDFGIARSRWSAHDSERAVGSPSYMAPEQIRGEKPDNKTDLFALAIVMYECLFGERPFVGSSSKDVLAAIVGGNWTNPSTTNIPSFDPQLTREFARAFATERKVRFGSGRELVEAFRPYLSGMPSESGGRSMLGSEVLGALRGKGQDSVRLSTNVPTSIATAMGIGGGRDPLISRVEPIRYTEAHNDDNKRRAVSRFEIFIYAGATLAILCSIFFLIEEHFAELADHPVTPVSDAVILGEGRRLRPLPEGPHAKLSNDELIAAIVAGNADANLVLPLLQEAQKRAVPMLPQLVTPYLVHPEIQVRIAAIRGLAHALPAEINDKLKPLTSDSDYTVRREAVVLLGERGGDAAKLVLAELAVTDRHPQVRAAAKFFLRGEGE